MMIRSQSSDDHRFVRWSIFDPNQFWGAILLGIVCGGVGGLFVGIISRGSMRIVALQAGLKPDFSIDGTLSIIVIGVVIGALGGLVYGIILPFLPGAINRKGLTFGGTLSLLFILIIAFAPLEGELALVSRVALVGLFASLPLVYGFLMAKVTAWLVLDESDLVEESSSFTKTAAFITIIAALIYVVIEITFIITYPDFSTFGYDASVFLDNVAGGVLLLMAIAGTAGLLRSGVTGKSAAAKVGLSLTLLLTSILGANAVGGNLNIIELHGLVRVMTQQGSDQALFSLLLMMLLVGLSGLLLAGIAALRTQRWQGWHRYSPLLVGLFPLFSLLFLHPSLLPSLMEISLPNRNRLAYLISAVFAFCWFLLGVALRAETNPGQRYASQDTTDQTVHAVQ